MEDIAEQQEVANEIAEAISNPVGFDRNVDDEELLRELEQLEQASSVTLYYSNCYDSFTTSVIAGELSYFYLKIQSLALKLVLELETLETS